jgi:hypothetical protein
MRSCLRLTFRICSFIVTTIIAFLHGAVALDALSVIFSAAQQTHDVNLVPSFLFFLLRATITERSPCYWL